MHYIVDIRDTVKEIKEKDLPEINGRAKVTNGSVAEIKAWRERLTGASWAMGVMFTVILIPLLTWAFVTISKIDDNINKGIQTALSNYDKP